MKLKPRKTPTTYVPKRAHRDHGVNRRQELDLRRMAGLIKDEPHLLSILAQTKPEMREAGFERIRKHLSFRLSENFSLDVLKSTELGP